ncbi:MAG: Peptidyl-dipeptidase dcp [Alphaproteobacteria bacterium ADurb.BinA280]|jgi:peptidyl-dipeptidase Dcp|nr:M3 family metallopeptidase [Xanthomonadales bacterium]MCC6506978.1 M3 family metallopeptidase [Aquimonas sp.]OPZ12857.1 MAG: Peptidyl-dipeptidase dcp [Alphaproteobacteria bacterium ADurb.BinA280]
MRLNMIAASLAIALGLAACSNESPAPVTEDTVKTETATPAAAEEANPFFAESALPYHAPDFTKIRDEHYLPALLEGMKRHIAEVEAIANNPEAATFDNTLVAMEKSGDLLLRAANVFMNLAGTDTNETIQKIQAEVAPKFAAHQDAILLNPTLFARVKSIYDARDMLNLDPESKRLVELYYDNHVRAGALLDEVTQAKVKALNEEQASLMTEFQQALMKQTQAAAVVIDDVAQLEGMDDAGIAAAAEAAKAKGLEGKWLVSITNTTRQPVLSQLKNREVRQRVFEASANRGLAEGDGDTRALVLRLATLRSERAALLGSPSWAAYALGNQMAGKPEAVQTMLADMVPPVMKNVASEAADIQSLIDQQGGGFKLEPWDWEFYAEQIRATRYDLDPNLVKPYFEFDRVLQDGLFFTMNKLYGISFKERKDIPVYHPDVRVFEVFESDGSTIGLFYADYFARDSKRGGAWMSSFVDQSDLLGNKPVVLNVMNIPKPAEGQPALMSFDEVTTMFHEMGHGLHGMLSKVRYPLLSGTNVPRDFVEFPSQFEEDWAKDPLVLANYAKHYKTGEPIPADLMAKVLKASSFNQGFDTLEYIKASLLDLEWHSIGTDAKPTDVAAFEAEAMAKHGVDIAAVPPRYRSAYFAHAFPGGYSAGYYAYLWSEVLAADAFAYLATKGGLTGENGDDFRNGILSRGATVEPMQMYIDWRGQAPDPKALLKRRGLTE